MPSDSKVAEAERFERDDRNIFAERRHRSGFREVPSCIYFHYIGSPTQEGVDPPIRRYYYTRVGDTIRYDEVRELVRDLALNARRAPAVQDPPADGDSLNFLVWSRKSYVAFLIDDPNSRFVQGNPIILDPDDHGRINFSFFDGWSEMVDLSPSRNGTQRRSAFCFMNHMKRDANSDLGHSNFHMPFKLNVIPQRHRVYPDSGGTNMGPPVPPP